MRVRVAHFAATLAAVVAVAGGLAAATTPQATQAAWTDQVAATATVTAGTWETPSGEACRASSSLYGATDCSITAITYKQTGSAINRIRTYAIQIAKRWDYPSTTFTAVLSGVSTPDDDWSWSDSCVVSVDGPWGARITADPLPTVSGAFWSLTSTPTFTVTVKEHRDSPGRGCR